MEPKEEAKEGLTPSGWNYWAEFYQHANQPGEYYRCVRVTVECSPLRFFTF